MEEILNGFIKPIIKQPSYIILGSIIGAFGMVNVLDSIIFAFLKQPWSLIPVWFRELLLVFRAILHPMFDFLLGWLSIELAGVWKDYLSMGIIVMFMRVRSTSVITEGIKKETLNSYKQKVLHKEIVLTKNSNRFTWFLFYSSRLAYALLLWPEKLFGAMMRFCTGNKKIVAEGSQVKEVVQSQYVVFFSSVFWFLIILVLFAIFKAASIS
ncbi:MULTISPECIES: hypothetical protein [unclassified Flavobacterium]|uniref:hypothetical protein n=1 Tax=unclassified Flavobacterium TaxID=196869 RepID=UPI000EAD1438|nr:MULTISPECIES: hypothetical protein [unclassified Flavobacterium]RKS03266.1 hypothetical protein C8C84_3010 [Flavobacterium sp. 102]